MVSFQCVCYYNLFYYEKIIIISIIVGEIVVKSSLDIAEVKEELASGNQ